MNTIKLLVVLTTFVLVFVACSKDNDGTTSNASNQREKAVEAAAWSNQI